MMLCFALGFAIASSIAPVPRAQDTLRVVAGRVRDEKGRKLSGAEVLDVERRILGTTDLDGWFSVRLPEDARTISFRRIGFKPAGFTFPKGWGLTDTVTVFLAETAQALPDLEVEAKAWKPVRYAGTTKYDDFFRRQRLGAGTYLSREQLDRKPAIQTLEYLQGIPGIRVDVGPPGLAWGNNLRIIRCSGPGARVMVWIDGVRQRGGPAIPAEVINQLSRISPGDIEMIEVYRGAATLPAEFHDDGCAAIAVWTRWNAPLETRDSTR
jgi:hypothetical protein